MLVVVSCGSGSSATPAPTAAKPSVLAGRIVFVDRQITPGPQSVYSIAADGNQRKLVDTPPQGPGEDDHPKFSPDGTKILFDRGELGKIMVVQADGTGLRAVALGCTESCLGDEEPAWSPDGNRIAFERAVGPLHNGIPGVIGIWIADANGANPRQVTQLALDSGWEDQYPSFSPDGRELVFMRNGNHRENLDQSSIWRIGVDGTNPHLVYRLPADRPGGGGKPRWSPDGSQILFSDACYFDSCPHPPSFVPQVFTIRPDGSDLRQLSNETAASSVPAWSPDGRSIVFSRMVANGLAACDGSATELYVMRADGTGIQRITTSMADGCAAYNPDWGV